MTFDDTNGEADQEFEMCRDTDGTLEYSTKYETKLLSFLQFPFCRVVKFSNIFHLTIHFPKNFGAESTKVYYIGLRGEFTPVIEIIKLTTIFITFFSHLV